MPRTKSNMCFHHLTSTTHCPHPARVHAVPVQTRITLGNVSLITLGNVSEWYLKCRGNHRVAVIVARGLCLSTFSSVDVPHQQIDGIRIGATAQIVVLRFFVCCTCKLRFVARQSFGEFVSTKNLTGMLRLPILIPLILGVFAPLHRPATVVFSFVAGVQKLRTQPSDFSLDWKGKRHPSRALPVTLFSPIKHICSFCTF